MGSKKARNRRGSPAFSVVAGAALLTPPPNVRVAASPSVVRGAVPDTAWAGNESAGAGTFDDVADAVVDTTRGAAGKHDLLAGSLDSLHQYFPDASERWWESPARRNGNHGDAPRRESQQ